MEGDSKNFDKTWRAYMRLRVALYVRKPIKRKMKIKKACGEWSWINFKYERLPILCFFYCSLGHAESYCKELFEYA